MMLRAAVLAMVCGGPVAWAGESFPYTGYINASDVYLRSGPGENYYPVSKLDRGEAVEIYRHDPGGWYAIRPTQDCYSWVSAEFLEPQEGNLAVVTGDRVVARVGSVFSDVRDVIQVRLERGETVEVIEAKRFNSGPAAQTWYKIAPPAGEFRWISGKFIDRELPEEKPRRPRPENNLLVARHAGGGDGEPTPADDEVADDDVAEDDADVDSDADRWWEDDAAEDRSDAQEDDGHDYPVRHAIHHSNVDEDASASDERRDPLQMVAAEEAIEVDDRDLSSKELAAELDLELSARAAREPDEWRFSDLKRRAEAALARAETATDRGRIRRVLKKIENFSQLERRYEAAMSGRDDADHLRATPSGIANSAASSAFFGGGQSRFDGVGRLTQVLSRNPGDPQFALLNPQGQVVYYVSPSPGVNLRRFLNQDVGINGALGYLPEQRARHVTAQRVISVDDRLLR